MCRHDNGDTAETFLFDDVVDEATTGDVQASRGFVEEEHVGFSGENLRELRALLLATREIAQRAVGL